MKRTHAFLRTAFFALFGALAVLSPSRASVAAPAPADRLQVLELVSALEHMPAARVLTSLLVVRFGADGRFVVSNDTPSLRESASDVRACDMKGFEPNVPREDADRRVDGKCLRALATRFGASRLVFGFVYTGADGRPWVKVRFWQQNSPDVTKALPFETEASARERLVERLYLHLARPDEAADVKVTAPSSASDGELFVDGKSQGAFRPGLELTLRAGEHAFEMRREGKAVANAKVTAVAGKPNEAQLAAVFMPRTDIPIEFPDPPTKATPPPQSTWQRPVGFVGLGVGAALIGAGVFSSLRVKSLDNEFDAPPLYAYRSGLSGDGCDAGAPSSQPGAATLGRVDRLCSALSTFRTLQYVFYGVGALAAGAGAYLLVTAPSAQPPTSMASPRRVGSAWSVQPWFGPTSGGVRLGSSFLPLGRASTMRKRYRWQAGSALATTSALAILAFAFGPGCDADTGGVSCEEAAQRGRPCSGSGGAGGGGASGTGGTPMNGTGGAPMMGQGGGGAGGTGGGTCTEDATCTPNGEGSLCVRSACTAPLELCKRVTVVVVDTAFTGELDGAPIDACYVRTLDAGLTAISPGTTKRLAVYADKATSANPIQLAAGVTLEGHGAQGPMTELGAGTGGPALVNLGEGAGLKGVKLDGKNGKAVLALSGTVTLSGPLELRGGAPAFSVEGTATATITGSKASPVIFTANARGVVVGATAALTMTGDGIDGTKAGLIVEGTTGGAGVLVETGGASAEVALAGVLLRDNQGGDGQNGTGALESRANRRTSVRECVFERNQRSVTLNGQGTDDPDLFVNVVLERNDFSNAWPLESGKGVALCGANFGAGNTALTLGSDNKLPSSAITNSQAVCDSLELSQEDRCDGGVDIGYTTFEKSFDLTCSGT